jgi:hypothetical protein
VIPDVVDALGEGDEADADESVEDDAADEEADY